MSSFPKSVRSQEPGPARRKGSRSRRFLILGLAGLWTLLLVWGLFWNLERLRENTLALATAQARTFADHVLVYRHWNAKHGGIYVEVSDSTPPNPYLADLPERDLRTPSGRQLTMVNPAYMMREIFSLEKQMYGLSGRITALHPLNPDNVPDSWEMSALLALVEGSSEVSDVVQVGDREILRLMRPLLMEAECLFCHAHHGYGLGEIRGGLSTQVDLQPWWAIGRAHRWGLGGGALLLWLLGLAALGAGERQLRRQENRRLRLEENLRYLEHFDSLTGLANQSQFFGKLDLFLKQRRAPEDLVAVVLLDLEDFRRINNALGRSQGDQLLRIGAQRLRVGVGEFGWVFYFGNGVFALLLPFVQQADEAGSIAYRALAELERPCLVDQGDVHLSAHCGLALAPRDGITAADVLRHAEIALHAAKAGQGERVRFFNRDLGFQAVERVQLEVDLRKALERDELFVLYQPQIEAESGAVKGAEALVRWRHPTRGILGPDRFIALAETSGLIVPLGEWVLWAVCRQIRRWREQNLEVPPIAVNLAAAQFRQGNLASLLARILEETGIAASCLSLEVTESALMYDLEQARSILGQLRSMGLHLAVDDFGTGYSSLSYLKNFPLDCLKIDRAFVRDLPGDAGSAAIVTAVVALGRSLGLLTLAEGVDAPAQYEFLRQAGCTRFQGFLFSEPLSAAEFIRRLHSRDARRIVYN
ncbi:putative bifunctional diguanylate cyclase/phosphodiesterase [Geoalkalibacter sp.]|uniref:putative bifunctional diguanylate cyclase/phosphodiesterase n=1 Tax=Geoalkalibacter sp. TaxID=3041440 RepID=UPI00272E0B20|nr:EAL domain-containing protein [Geoalkalibacter sp.]